MNRVYNFKEKKLILQGNEVEFEYCISEVFFCDGIYTILLSIPNEIEMQDNIYGVNASGEVIWRIENPSSIYPVQKIGIREFDNLASTTYVHISIGVDNVLIAHTFFSIKYSFNYQTGKLLNREIGRW